MAKNMISSNIRSLFRSLALLTLLCKQMAKNKPASANGAWHTAKTRATEAHQPPKIGCRLTVALVFQGPYNCVFTVRFGPYSLPSHRFPISGSSRKLFTAKKLWLKLLNVTCPSADRQSKRLAVEESKTSGDLNIQTFYSGVGGDQIKDKRKVNFGLTLIRWQKHDPNKMMMLLLICWVCKQATIC